jgi:hypothetical protein
MSPEIHSIADVPEALLETIRRSGPAGVFYHRGLLELWERSFGWRGLVVHAENATMVGFVKTTALGRVFYSLPYGWHGGFVGSPAEPSSASVILGWLESQGFLQETIVQSGAFPAEGYPGRYRRRELTTHVLDLGASAPYSTNATRNLKKARGAGLDARPLAREQREPFTQLLRAHVHRTGEARILPEAFYLELFALGLRSDSGVEVRGAFLGSELVACHVYFRTASDGFYFDGFCNQPGLDTCANFLLFDDVIRGSRERGIARFNFGATPEGDEGLERFKAGWGAVAVGYREYDRRSPVKRAVDALRGR